jgi:hypothetical protein
MEEGDRRWLKGKGRMKREERSEEQEERDMIKCDKENEEEKREVRFEWQEENNFFLMQGTNL